MFQKKKKGYKVKNGHRQALTEILISVKNLQQKADTKKEAKKPVAKSSTKNLRRNQRLNQLKSKEMAHKKGVGSSKNGREWESETC